MEAQKAFASGEVPVGAVVVCRDRIIGRGHNLTEILNDVTAHAEMQAITAAANNLGGKYLNECTLYVTVEPCVMCAGAIAWAQTGKLDFRGMPIDKTRLSKVMHLIALHPKTVVIKGVLADECAQLMKDFFRKTMITGDRRRVIVPQNQHILLRHHRISSFYCLLTCDVCLKLSRFQHSCHWHLAVC